MVRRLESRTNWVPPLVVGILPEPAAAVGVPVAAAPPAALVAAGVPVPAALVAAAVATGVPVPAAPAAALVATGVPVPAALVAAGVPVPEAPPAGAVPAAGVWLLLFALPPPHAARSIAPIMTAVNIILSLFIFVPLFPFERINKDLPDSKVNAQENSSLFCI